jgi:hypothetical protein
MQRVWVCSNNTEHGSISAVEHSSSMSDCYSTSPGSATNSCVILDKLSHSLCLTCLFYQLENLIIVPIL